MHSFHINLEVLNLYLVASQGKQSFDVHLCSTQCLIRFNLNNHGVKICKVQKELQGKWKIKLWVNGSFKINQHYKSKVRENWPKIISSLYYNEMRNDNFSSSPICLFVRTLSHQSTCKLWNVLRRKDLLRIEERSRPTNERSQSQAHRAQISSILLK